MYSYTQILFEGGTSKFVKLEICKKSLWCIENYVGHHVMTI